MDMALGLRTMVIPTANNDSLYNYRGTDSRREWTIHLQVRQHNLLLINKQAGCVLTQQHGAIRLMAAAGAC